MTPIIDALVSLSGPLVYIIVGLLAFSEAAAFVGLVLPGETALFIGGVIASQGHVNLGVMLGVAVVAAIAGDSVGYEIARRFGPALKNSRAGRFVGEDKWTKGEQFLARRGGTAVLLGRWVGLLRALVPAIAGMARMPYKTFLLYNSIGGTIWAVTVVLLGYYAGQSYKTVEQYLGKASLILTLILAGAFVLALLARFALRNPRWTRARVEKIAVLPVIAAPHDGVGAVEADSEPPSPHRRRHRLSRTGTATSITMIVALLALTVGYNLLTGTGRGMEVTTALGAPIRTWFLEHQDDEFTALMQILTVLGHPVVALGTLFVCMSRYRPPTLAHARRYALFLCSGVAAAILAATVVPIPIPSATGHTGLDFLSPAGQTLASAALLTASAWLLVGFRTTTWRTFVVTLTILAALTPLIALSHNYLAQQNPIDVIFGWTFGTLFAAALAAASSLIGVKPSVPAGEER